MNEPFYVYMALKREAESEWETMYFINFTLEDKDNPTYSASSDAFKTSRNKYDGKLYTDYKVVEVLKEIYHYIVSPNLVIGLESCGIQSSINLMVDI